MKKCLAGILSLIMVTSVLTGCFVDVPEGGDKRSVLDRIFSILFLRQEKEN